MNSDKLGRIMLIERILQVVDIAFRRWVIFLIPVLIAIPLALLIVAKTPTKYEATSIILLQSANAGGVLSSGSAGENRQSSLEQVQAMEAWLKSDHVLSQILPEIRDNGASDDPIEVLVEMVVLRNSLKLELLGNSVLELRLEGRRAEGLGRKLEVIVSRLMEGLVQPDTGILSASQLVLLRRSDLLAERERELNAAITSVGIGPVATVRQQLKSLHELKSKRQKEGIASSNQQVRDATNTIHALRKSLSADATVSASLERTYDRFEDARSSYFALLGRGKSEGRSYIGIFDSPERLRIIGRPRDPITGNNPGRKIAIAGLLLSLFAGAGLVFLLELLGNRVYLRDEFEELAGVPVIARLPRLGASSNALTDNAPSGKISKDTETDGSNRRNMLTLKLKDIIERLQTQDAALKQSTMAGIVCKLALAIIFVGVVIRISPLFDIGGRVFWQFMTEDGYLMQTVARNMALGFGMSSGDGSIPTNGVQPLATFIFAALHWIAGGDRSTAIVLVTIISLVIALGAAYFLYSLSKRLLGNFQFRNELALVIAAVWFVGPLALQHSMNGLETGLYCFVLLATLNYYVSCIEDGSSTLSLKEQGVLGVLLGLTFLSRNDAVFFIAALLVAHLCIGPTTRTAITRRLVECMSVGTLSVVTGLPWLVNNFLLFGTIIPISGLSQSYNVGFGHNIRVIPANMIEAMFPFIPIPRALESMMPLVLVSTAILLAVLAALWIVWARFDDLRRRAFVIIVLFSLCIGAYYGLFFGAPHFVSRYMAPLSPLLWFAAVVVGFSLMAGLVKQTRIVSAAFVCFLGLCLFGAGAFGWRSFGHGTNHMHKQVVMWVEKNLDQSQWAGAVQTGTLGFFHSRTLNLDGKVNPKALEVLLEKGHILDYVIDTPVQYIVDWAGMADWVDFKQATKFRKHFKVIVRDHDANLAVLERKDS